MTKKLTGGEKKKGTSLAKQADDEKQAEAKAQQQAANPNDPIKIKTCEVKVKLDKDCGLPEAAGMVLEEHAGDMLTALLKSLDSGKDVTDKYLVCKTSAIRVKDWSILDLRPKGTPAQGEMAS